MLKDGLTSWPELAGPDTRHLGHLLRQDTFGIVVYGRNGQRIGGKAKNQDAARPPD